VLGQQAVEAQGAGLRLQVLREGWGRECGGRDFSEREARERAGGGKEAGVENKECERKK
jgi:hypothetical protein